MFDNLIITCEHATNFIPDNYIKYFNDDINVLKTHKAFDIGAESICKILFDKYSLTYYKPSVSRLLIDCNRSLSNKNLISSYLNTISDIDKHILIEKYYMPYRNNITNIIKNTLENKKKVLHFSIHSFTPILNDVKRNADIGILYDPARLIEKSFTKILKDKLKSDNQNLIIKLNYPYKGTSDGFTTYLRKKLNSEDYCGIEIEINQNIIYENALLNTIIPILGNFMF